MQNLLLSTLLYSIITLSLSLTATQAQSGVYVGGPMYYSRDVVVNELKSSGFTHVTVWTIHIMENGDLNFNAEFPLCSNGEYIGNDTYPEFTNDIANLKEKPTTITRIEFGLSAWGSSTYSNVKKLIDAEGTGPESILYKNFAALKQAIPDIDALNNDDEGTYDLESTIAFSVMLADLGFKNTLCPYTNMQYWSNLADSIQLHRPGNVDAVYLQCYAGGSFNNPCQWEDSFEGISVWPGIWSHDPVFITNRMTDWHNECETNGGWLWLYDEFYGDIDRVRKAASALNLVFGIEYSDTIPSPATNPKPIRDKEECSLKPRLEWSMGFGASEHHIYLGEKAELDDSHLISTQTKSELLIKTALKGNTTYYWRVDELNQKGSTPSEVWSFKTLEYEYQAEDYTSWFGCKIDSAETGYTNKGYVDYGGMGAYTEYNIDVGGSADVTLLIYYTNGSDAASRECDVLLNDSNVGHITFPVTENWKDWQAYEFDINLNANYNVLRLEQSSSGGPNIDRIGIRIKERHTQINTNKNQISELKISPVPSHDIVTIKGLKQGELYSVYSYTGKFLFSSNEIELPISQLPNGCCFILTNGLKKGSFIKY